MVKYKSGFSDPLGSRVVYLVRKHTNSRSRRILLANTLCLILFTFAFLFAHHKTPEFQQLQSNIQSAPSNVYYISKRALCSRSIAYDKLAVQPIAVSKVILRPVVRSGKIENYDDRLEVLEDAMINDVVFLDRNVTGVDAELSANVCPLHTVSILPSQKPTRYSASSILFGVAMSVDEIPKSLKHWRFWARNFKAAFYVLLPSTDYHRIKEAEEMFRGTLGLKAKVEAVRDTDDPAKLMIILVKRMKTAAPLDVRWFMLLNAGTFVTSLDDVLLALEPHDSMQALYMGAVTESKGQRDQYGMLAYGGAGIVLSRPLVDSISTNSKSNKTALLISVNQCLKIQDMPYGDGLLSMCINRFTTAELTILPTFHQTDLVEDISGFLQGPLEFATLWNISPDANVLFPKWHPVGPESPNPSTYAEELELFHLSRRILGSQNWGIRYRFGKSGRYVLTNGYSITEFLRPPYPTNFDIRNGVEGTFWNDNDVEEFTFHVSHGKAGGIKEVPMRHGLREADDKRTYYLRAIEMRETQASPGRAQKNNQNRKEAAVFIYTNEWGSVRRGIEVVWLL